MLNVGTFKLKMVQSAHDSCPFCGSQKLKLRHILQIVFLFNDTEEVITVLTLLAHLGNQQ